MKKLDIVLSGRPNGPWVKWLNGLCAAGFVLNVIEMTELHLMKRFAAGAVLLDGLLPDLGRLISEIRQYHPDIQMVVAVEVDSFAIYYEVMHFDEAIYISGPMTTAEFVSTMEHIVGSQPVYA